MGSITKKQQLGDYLRKRRKQLGYTLEDVSRTLQTGDCPVSLKTISRWETGEGIPNALQFLSLCRALRIRDVPDVLNRLEAGEPLNEEGLRKVEEYRNDLIASGRYCNRTEDPAPVLTLPVYSLRVSAGVGDVLGDDRPELVQFDARTVPSKAQFGLIVSGDSMEPEYHDGQTVFVEKTNSLENGEVGIFDVDGCAFIKQLVRTPSCADDYQEKIRLVSLNPRYAPIDVTPSTAFCVFGRVVGHD